MADTRRRKRRKLKFTHLMQIKLLAVFALVLLALVFLLVRITMITTKSGNRYAQQVLSQQSYDSQALPYRRGEIQDRNGIILAKSERVYNVILDCKEATSDTDFIEPTIEVVSSQLGVDAAQIRNLLESEETKNSQYQVIKKNISETERQEFLDYISTGPDKELSETLEEKLSNVRGIWFEEHYLRNYPYNSLASNTIGFSNDLDDGICGLELYYDDILKGTNGRIFGYLNDDSEFQKTTIEPENGKTIVTTLDMNIQSIVEKYIAEYEGLYEDKEKKEKGAKNVGIVVMDPNTGEILAMGTNSSFNLNDPYDLTKLYTGAAIKGMSEPEYVEALGEMWSNFCVSEGYEPGSVVKPVTVASALQIGACFDGDHYYCDGGEFITDTTIKCDNIYGHGDETLEYAIVNSCNDALMQIGMKMGISNFCQYQRSFGFGSPTGIDLPNENPGVLYTENTMHEVELATCTFGQGFTMNMIQEIAAISAVVNGGYYYQPHIVKQVQNSDGSVVKNINPLLLKQPVSSQVSSLVRSYMKTAVEKGTGRKAQVPGYQVGGKTGTAEKIDLTTGTRASEKYLVSFIGAAPINDPQVVIYVIIDEPNVPNQADSGYPQILFRQIANEVFPYMGFYPTEEVTYELLTYLGMSWDDVVMDGRGNGETFQAFDSSGTLHNGCYVNSKGEVVTQDGSIVEGAYINAAGNAVDGYGNEIELKEKVEVLDPKADNPDIPAPPEAIDDGSSSGGTHWDGVTNEDLDYAENSWQDQ